MAIILNIQTDARINAIKTIRQVMPGDPSLMFAKDCVECGIIFHDMDSMLRFMEDFEHAWKRDYTLAVPAWRMARYFVPEIRNVPRVISY